MKLLTLLFIVLLTACNVKTDNCIETTVQNPNIKKTINTNPTVLAIASIETESFTVDYPKCDNKKRLACNYSIYKMNGDMLEVIGADLSKMNDVTYATQQIIKALNQFGYDDFMAFHRGGRSGLNGTAYGEEIKEYKKGIERIKHCYNTDPESFNNNVRYTTFVPAI